MERELNVRVCLSCGKRIELGSICDKCSKRQAKEEQEEHDAWFSEQEFEQQKRCYNASK